MWLSVCRALVAAVAVTYILCVLILNGLQKEDFDVSTLKKLQRHDVNIEDMNNDAMRKECEMGNRNSSTINSDTKTVTLRNDPEVGDKQEVERIKLNDSNLFSTITHYFSKVKPNNNSKVNNEDVEKFINIWNMMSGTKDYAVESTTKAITSTVFMPTHKPNEKLEYINKILENYINNQKTTTTKPTTNIVDYDLIAQKIKELLDNNKTTQKPLELFTVEETLRRYFSKEEPLHNTSTQSTRDILTLNNKTTNKNIDIKDKQDPNNQEEETISPDNSPNNMETANEDPKYKSDTKKEINTLSEDIIRELSESVRAKVLQDLKKIISTTSATKKSRKRTTKSTTARATTTVKPTEITTTVNKKHENKELAVTDVLEKFMEMFQQFKTNKKTPTTKKVATEDTNIKTEDKTPTINVNVIKPVPVNITSVIINPYNTIHAPVIQTAVMPNEHYNFLNIHAPLQNIIPAKIEHNIPQLNIYNTNNNFHATPITIQTNSVEVHPLGLPAQQTFVYQNIVVTPKRPSKVRYDFPTYKTVQENRKFDERKYKDQNVEYTRSSRVNYNREFGIGKHARSREYINDEYINQRNKHKPIKYKEYGRSYSNDRNERFHEKLERADDWSRNPRDRSRSRENSNIDDNYDTKSKFISRQQLPINSAKKRSRYDDAHFRNFLRTQQKVNDMLERILATKNNSSGPRSVETTVT